MRSLLTFGMLFLVLVSACRQPESAVDVENRIRESEILQRLDRLCTELPKPEGFEFVKKSISGNSFTVSLSYDFRSSMPYDRVYDYYKRVLPPLGWQPGPSGYYEKGSQQVSVSSVVFPNVDYSLYCAEVVK